MNPNLEVHEMYAHRNVLEHERLTVTRFRLSSHNLAIETGRLSRRPRDSRLCPECRLLQDERHALAECQINSDIRDGYHGIDFALPTFFSHQPIDYQVKVCHELIRPFVL